VNGAGALVCARVHACACVCLCVDGGREAMASRVVAEPAPCTWKAQYTRPALNGACPPPPRHRLVPPTDTGSFSHREDRQGLAAYLKKVRPAAAASRCRAAFYA